VPNIAVCCSSLISCFPSMLLRYFLNDFELVPVAPIISGVTFAFTFHIHSFFIVRNLHYRILSNPFLTTFLSPEIATSINILSTNKTAAYTHESSPCCKPVAYPGIFFGGGVQQFQLRTEERKDGDLGAVDP